jgi:hypothetical protein
MTLKPRPSAFGRIEYDVETAKQKIRDAGLPSLLADRLDLGK